MTDKLNFLILHNMGPRAAWLSSVADIELALPRYAPQHNYIVHNAFHELPDFAKSVNYDCIVIGPTFLGSLPNELVYEKFVSSYNFIKEHDAYKIALPQDDYWCSEVRDNFYVDFKINEVRPVCRQKYWNILYPKYSQSNNKMTLGYTIYITPRLRKRSIKTKQIQERPYDVVYRATGKPFFPNRLGFIKAQIGERFKNKVSGYELNLDISTKAEDKIRGDGWLDFVESSRSILGSNSGSSVLIRNHAVVKKIQEYEIIHPAASYEEILDACVQTIDRINEFSAISPRNIEAGLLGTAQLTVPGPYSDILFPWEHYIPLNEDCSNIDEIIDSLKDISKLKIITMNCRTALLDCAKIQVESFVKSIIDAIENHLTPSKKRVSPYDFEKIMKRYERLIYTKDLFYPSLIKSKSIFRKVIPTPILNTLRRLRATINE